MTAQSPPRRSLASVRAIGSAQRRRNDAGLQFATAVDAVNTPTAQPPLDETTLSPMMTQWSELKRRYASHVLLYRLGDFYETFDADAVTAADVLNITLTRRHGHAMAGFPFFSLNIHLRKFLSSGRTVAVVEQSEAADDRRRTHKLVARNVVRIVTPGMPLDEQTSSRHHSYCLTVTSAPRADDDTDTAITGDAKLIGAAAVDVATGEFFSRTLQSAAELTDLIALTDAREVVVSASTAQRNADLIDAITLVAPHVAVTVRADSDVDETCQSFIAAAAAHTQAIRTRTANEARTPLFTPALDDPTAVLNTLAHVERRAVASLFDYIHYCYPITLPVLFQTQYRRTPLRADANSADRALDDSLHINAYTRRALELTHSMTDHNRRRSLLTTIDRTVTSGGARLLSSWIARPLTDVTAIDARLDVVAVFKSDLIRLTRLRRLLRQSTDVLRCLQRAAQKRITPRDLCAVAKTVRVAEKCRALLQQIADDTTRHDARQQVTALLRNDIHQRITALATLIETAVIDDPPIDTSNGNFIRNGYSTRLDGARAGANDTSHQIQEIQGEYRRTLGIERLTVKHNSSVGLCVEINANTAKQTAAALIADCGLSLCQQLTTVWRYKSSRLNQLQSAHTDRARYAVELERSILEDIREEIISSDLRIMQLSTALARVDALSALAQLANDNDYCRPTFTSSQAPFFHVVNGRHPVIEARRPEKTDKALSTTEPMDDDVDGITNDTTESVARGDESAFGYTPNDCHLSASTALWLLTGPNMSGNKFIHKHCGERS